jgi:hypothetical protein
MKISLTIIFFIISTLIFSGCLNKSNSIDFNLYSYENLFPIIVIDAPEKAYFDDTIEFDATESYDSDGNIISYYWNFGDGNTSKGKKVCHSYKFENDFNINYPLIYTYSLIIVDDNRAKIVKSSEIMMYPNKYQLFFQSGSLEREKPSFSEDFVKTSFGMIQQKSSKILSYKLREPINLSECSWNVSLCLKKPLLTRFSKVKIVLLDSENNEISKAEKKFGLFRFWNKKTIELSGKIFKNSEFYSIKLFFYRFSLRNKISILYGSELPSNICFNFRN